MTKALIVVDVQNDFVEGGSLAVAGGLDLAQRISTYVDQNHHDYAAIVASKDYHDGDNDNEGHFAAPGTEPDFDKSWPVHCVGGETGSDFAPGLDSTHFTHEVHKGMGCAAYSAFEGITEDNVVLGSLLSGLGVDEVHIVGIATDYCVRATALDGATQGFSVTVLSDLAVGINEAKIAETLTDELPAAGVKVA